MKNKIIASSLAGLALFGGTIAFAVSGSTPAGATGTAQAALTQDAAPSGVRGWLHQHRKEIRKQAIETAATTIGIPADELRADLKAGQSVAEVATAKGVDPQTVVDAWVKGADAKIDQAVTDGKLTQAQADKAKAKVPTIAGKLVNAHRGDHKKAAGN
ncbi:MAG TPA: hypothetical protein VIJ47_13695 [Acidimicrobiales bacterium]